MARTYELALVLDPRMSDGDVTETVAKYKSMIEADNTALITTEDNWGKRKLAYPIRKFNEGRYVFLYVQTKGGFVWGEIERVILQNEQVLRHLVVRTDPDLKRAERKGKVKPSDQPGEAREKTQDDASESDNADE